MVHQSITLEIKLSPQITAHISQGLEFDGTGREEPQHKIAVAAALAQINSTIDILRQEFVIAPNDNQSSDAITDENQDGYLSTVTWQGKTYVKYFGGRWVKYGVNVWPEVLSASGIEAAECAQKYDLSGFTTTIAYDVNGKPRRVVKIVKTDLPF